MSGARWSLDICPGADEPDESERRVKIMLTAQSAGADKQYDIALVL